MNQALFEARKPKIRDLDTLEQLDEITLEIILKDLQRWMALKIEVNTRNQIKIIERGRQ